jgi:transposase-like protein
MAQPLRLHQIRKIVELSQQGRGIRQIQRLTGLALNIIREYRRRIIRSGLSWDQLQALDEHNL